MKPDELREIIKLGYTDIMFTYNDIFGCIDPYYDTKEKRKVYQLYYNRKNTFVYSLDDAMKTPFINGMCLEEVAKYLEVDD